MIKIQQPIEELKIAPEVTIGNRTRYSTATAVSFINENLLVAAAFNSKKIYLIELLVPRAPIKYFVIPYQ